MLVYSSTCESVEVGESAAVAAISQGSFIIPKTLYLGNRDKYDLLLFAHKVPESSDRTLLSIKSMTMNKKKYLPGDRYEYFNVLWVQPGHPAYRRGAGKICKTAFMSDMRDIAEMSFA